MTERISGKHGSYLDLYPDSGYDPTVFERPTLTADIVIFRLDPSTRNLDRLQVLLIERKFAPYAGCFAFPGGFVNIQDKESVDHAALRELEEETSIPMGTVPLHQFKTYASYDRDPRWYTADVSYFCLLHHDQADSLPIKANDDAATAQWVTVSTALAGTLAFDHHTILSEMLAHLQKHAWDEDILRGLAVSPKDNTFTMRDVHGAYEALRGPIDLSNFGRMFKHRFAYAFSDSYALSFLRGSKPTRQCVFQGSLL